MRYKAGNAEETMQIHLTSRHFKATDKLKMFVENEVQRLEKYYDGIIEGHVILDYVKAPYSKHNVEIHIKVYGRTLKAHALSDDMYKSIDKTREKLERKLKKYKAKVRGFTHQKVIDYMAENSSWEEEE